MIPTVGRIVHYHSYGTPGGEFKPEPRAAIVTAVRDDIGNEGSPGPGLDGFVDLCAINPTGLFFNLAVPYSETPKPGHWSWPPRSP